jgi:hypothetical protein
VLAKMRNMPIHDFFADRGFIGADGRMVHEMYLVEVKKTEESHYDWDYYKYSRSFPAKRRSADERRWLPASRSTLDTAVSRLGPYRTVDPQLMCGVCTSKRRWRQ